MIPVLFEDDDYLVVDKPEGLASIPERDPERPSLLGLLESERGAKLFVVHRLDKEVSGVIAFAKHADAHRHLNDLFSTREVHKTYVALVHGPVDRQRGVIDAPIRTFGSGRMGVDAARGKPSRTEYEVEERAGSYTRLRLRPVTGRRHQLRVHLYHIDHPIVGDPLYGDRALQQSYPRLMLHAHVLAFRDRAGRRRQVEAAPPESFRTAYEQIT